MPASSWCLQHIRWLASLGLCLALARPGMATVEPDRLASLELEQLMDLEITSVAKHRQRLGEAAAAVSVITREDIRRSGHATLPEVLRMVPGIQVARINGNHWAVTARGFNNLYAGNLLVLVDGRSIYTPLFGGVFWDMQDLMLDEVERIEVIRGPGGALWGSNATNGVINIITRHSRETQGSRVSLAAGTGDHLTGEARQGGQWGENLYYRLSVKAFDRQEAVFASGADSNDRWQAEHADWRVDWQASPRDEVTLTGGVFDNQASNRQFQVLNNPPYARWLESEDHTNGQHLLAQWQRELDATSDITLRGFYEGTHWRNLNLTEKRDTLDLEFQHHQQTRDRHELTWGLGYRGSWDQYRNSPTLVMSPAAETQQLFNLFAQDEIPLAGEELKLILGAKMEHNPVTRWEVQPNARLLWQPAADHALWTSVARAVRIPSRSYTDMDIHIARFPMDFVLFGNSRLAAEEMIAYEAGYRGQVTSTAALAASFFVHDYQKLFTPEALPNFSGLQHTNHKEGYTYGLELEGSWDVTRYWRLLGGYGYLEDHLVLLGPSRLPVPPANPRHQGHLISRWNLAESWELDGAWYYMDRLPSLEIPAYHRLDFRLGWQPRPVLEASLVVQNLLDDRHPEYVSTNRGLQEMEIGRGVLGRLTWRW